MAKRTISRPKIDQNEDDLLKINAIQLDPRALGTPEDIIKYARKNNFITRDERINIQALIENNNELELVFEDIAEDGKIIYSPATKKYIITINKRHPETRQRFTMAHEYIHYQINRDIIQKNAHTDIILYRDATTKLDIDIEANQYASEILMPTPEFRQILQEYKGNILKMAEVFGVSSLAVRYRAKNLGYNDNDL